MARPRRVVRFAAIVAIGGLLAACRPGDEAPAPGTPSDASDVPSTQLDGPGTTNPSDTTTHDFEPGDVPIITGEF